MPAKKRRAKTSIPRWADPFWRSRYSRNRKKPKLKAPTRPAPPPQKLAPTPTPPLPRRKLRQPLPKIKPKKRDKYQVAGLLRKGGTVKRKPVKRYKKGGAAKKHRRG